MHSDLTPTLTSDGDNCQYSIPGTVVISHRSGCPRADAKRADDVRPFLKCWYSVHASMHGHAAWP